MKGRCARSLLGMPASMATCSRPHLVYRQLQRSVSRVAVHSDAHAVPSRLSEARAPGLANEHTCSPAGEARSIESTPSATDNAATGQHAASTSRTCSSYTTAAVSVALLAALSCSGGAALAATHAEPSNALSVPTWVIHVSSVIEWTTAMLLMWRYAEVTGNEKWKGMTWGMMPLFSGALCACTYHFFYNTTQLDFLVTLQASLTWIGNATLWAAAYRIFKDSQSEAA